MQAHQVLAPTGNDQWRTISLHQFSLINSRFSTNFRRFHLATDSLVARYTIREITARTLPEDFRDARPHRAWRLVRRQ